MNLDERARRAAAATRQQAEQIDTDDILARVRGSRTRWRWLAPAGTVAAAAAVLVAMALILPDLGPDGFEITPEPVGPGASSPTEADPSVPAAPGPSPTTTEASGCSAADGPSDPTPQAGLPDPVSDTRHAIQAAAARCDVDGLAELALAASRDFTYSFGESGDPASHWRRLEEEGADPLLTLIRLLDLPHATVETQFEADRYETIHVWPSAFAEDATDADWQAVVDAGLVTREEAQRMRDEFGGYLGHRVGITSDGEWVFFVAGD